MGLTWANVACVERERVTNWPAAGVSQGLGSVALGSGAAPPAKLSRVSLSWLQIEFQHRLNNGQAIHARRSTAAAVDTVWGNLSSEWAHHQPTGVLARDRPWMRLATCVGHQTDAPTLIQSGATGRVDEHWPDEGVVVLDCRESHIARHGGSNVPYWP